MKIKMGLQNIRTENIINGMKKLHNNAESLLSEALLLESNNRFARAYCLAEFAIEELAKIRILFDLWIDRINNNSIDYKQLDKDFLSHTTKIEISNEFEIFLSKLIKTNLGIEIIDNIIKDKDELLRQIDEINTKKNESLYVSIKNNDFQSPEEIINKDKCNSILGRASILTVGFTGLIKRIESSINEIASVMILKNAYYIFNTLPV